MFSAYPVLYKHYGQGLELAIETPGSPALQPHQSNLTLSHFFYKKNIEVKRKVNAEVTLQNKGYM